MEELIVINKGYSTIPTVPNPIQKTIYFIEFEDENGNKYVWRTETFRPDFTAIANKNAKMKIRFKYKPKKMSVANPEYIDITNVTLKEFVS